MAMGSGREGKPFLRTMGEAIGHMLGIPQRALAASEGMRAGGDYDAGPVVDASLLAMGATPLGASARAGEAVLGAGPVSRAALDMSQEARMARAAEQGFDTSRPLYHGTSKDVDFKKFKDSRHGTWTTDDPASASMYAKNNDSKNLVLDHSAPGYQFKEINSADRVLPLYAKPMANPYTVTEYPEAVRNATNYKRAQSEWFDHLKRQGHDGLLMPGGVRVDFRNENLRSTFAPFDPKNAGKPMILGAGPTDPTSLAALLAARSDQ